MDLKRLRTFVAVAEQGTVSRAAETLRITQPALSRQIKALEDDVGFALFNRTGRKLTLTPSGEQFLGECHCLLEHVDSVDARVQALRQGNLASLRVACSSLTVAGLFPAFLRHHAERMPGLQLSLVEADAGTHFDLLESGAADLSINVINDLQIDANRFGTHLLPKFHVMAACTSRFPLAAGDAIEIRQLTHHPLLLMNPSFATRNVFEAACQLAGCRPNVLIESSSAHTLLALAEAGHGIAIIPSILDTEAQSLRLVRVTHMREPLLISLAVLWDKRRTLPRHADRFSGLLSEHIRSTFPAVKMRRKTRLIGPEPGRRPATRTR
jgi:DNA-binding transcriptional LysR family regulator